MSKQWRIWVCDQLRGTASLFPGESGVNYVIWSPDGKRLVFGEEKAGITNVYWQAADGGPPKEALSVGEYARLPVSWSPDGETLALLELRSGAPWHVLFAKVRDGRVISFLNSGFIGAYPEFSPDGHWIAYVAYESGRPEVYVRPFPGPGGMLQISHEGGYEPLWARNGNQLFYRWQDQVWGADVQTGAAFSAGKPRLLFQQRGFGSAGPSRGWDISPDGKRFLMVRLEERKPQPVTELILVQNWFEELKRLCPTGK